MTSTIGAIFRAGMIAGACSGAGIAVMSYGKCWNQVTIQGGEEGTGRIQFLGLGPIASNPRMEQFKNHGTLTRRDLRWLQGQWNAQTNMAHAVSASQEEATCRGILGGINTLLQSRDADGVKVFRLDVMGRMTKLALEEELDRRPQNRQFDPVLADDVEALYGLAQEEIANDHKWADYHLGNSLLLGLLGMALVFADLKMKSRVNVSAEETRNSMETIASTLASGDLSLQALSQLRYLRVSLGLVGAAAAALAGGMAVHHADSVRRAHAPIPVSECASETAQAGTNR